MVIGENNRYERRGEHCGMDYCSDNRFWSVDGVLQKDQGSSILTYDEVFHDVVIVRLLISASKGRRHGSESSQGKEADQCPFCPS